MFVDLYLYRRIMSVISTLQDLLEKPSLLPLLPVESKKLLEQGKENLNRKLKGTSGRLPWQI